MERIAVNEQNCSLLFSHLKFLLDSLGHQNAVSECETLHSLLALTQRVAYENTLHGAPQSFKVMVAEVNCKRGRI